MNANSDGQVRKTDGFAAHRQNENNLLIGGQVMHKYALVTHHREVKDEETERQGERERECVCVCVCVGVGVDVCTCVWM